MENFQDPYAPRWLRLPAGSGESFVAQMRVWLEDVAVAVRGVFSNPFFEQRLQLLETERVQREVDALSQLEDTARQSAIRLVQTEEGLRFVPEIDGKLLDAAALHALPEAQRTLIHAALENYADRMKTLLDQFALWQRESHRAAVALERDLAARAIEPLMVEQHERWSQVPRLTEHLAFVAEDLLRRIGRLRGELGEVDHISEWLDNPESLAARYQVHLMVSRVMAEGAPVEYWNSTGRESLLGCIEPRVQPGVQHSDLRLLRAGALHRANGGYLIVDAEKLMADPELWNEIKQVLATGRLEPFSGQRGGDGIPLQPKALPVQLCVIMIGDRGLYYQLAEQDPEFLRLFKVQVDLADQLAWTPEHEHVYVTMLATLIRRDDLMHLSADAAARMVEEGARLMDDAERLTTNLGLLADLLREADYWAHHMGHEQIHLADVTRAINEQERRAGRVQERIHEDILRNNVMIHTQGMLPAQVNGLMVMEMSDFAFGLPSRITATAWLGEGEIIDIEREVQLGGALHSKGVLILSQYVGARFARTQTLSLTASLVFEQSYGPLDGDSASLGELCALLSALAEMPVAQHLGVTGSVNQFGEVQSIGAVNEKIEGFFDICRARGFTGDQGVILPASNITNLMLRRDVIDAVDEGRFHLYAVEHVDQAMALLSGLEAGEPDGDGRFPPESVNGRVAARVQEFARLRQQQENVCHDDEAAEDAASRNQVNR